MPVEDLMDLLDMKPFALRQQQVDEQSAKCTASRKEEEDPGQARREFEILVSIGSRSALT